MLRQYPVIVTHQTETKGSFFIYILKKTWYNSNSNDNNNNKAILELIIIYPMQK